MSHEIEMVNGEASMAYVGEVPWHGLGVRVPEDLTPEQMLDAANLNWEVEKTDTFTRFSDGREVKLNTQALVRKSDNKILDVVSEDWNPVQNVEAFEFFNDFIMAGDMEMHTAGSLRGGQIVWALAKVKNSFELFGGDRVESYLHFSNFHKYGHSTDIRFTPIRVVCNNTLTLSLNSKVERMVKINHRRQFNPENVKTMLGIADEKLAKYREMAKFLGSKRFTDENIVEYYKRVFPNTNETKKDVMSKNANRAYSVLESQPGHEYAEGTWWSAFNSVTFMVDHLVGRSQDTRLASAWYGVNKDTKLRALTVAVEMAEAA
jgi:phage/plasmid-like protein (TIGR03299 family)